jgi:RecB family endonuclease NucS
MARVRTTRPSSTKSKTASPGLAPVRVRAEVAGPLVLLADCEVYYEGRAGSTLRRGHYLILRKEDGSFLVHGAKLTVPLNYQPAGSRLFRTDDGYLCVSRKEVMRVVVHGVADRLAATPWDDGPVRVVRTERQLRDKLARTIDRFIPHVRRVVVEYPTAHGAVDLVAVDRRGVRHAVEVKRAVATVQAGVQIRKYLEALADEGHAARGYVAAPAVAGNACAYYARHGVTYLSVRHARRSAGPWGGCPERLCAGLRPVPAKG